MTRAKRTDSFILFAQLVLFASLDQDRLRHLGPFNGHHVDLVTQYLDTFPA